MHKVVGGNYLAGIWKQNFLIGLLWSASSTRNRLTKPTKWRAPSWSWAALDSGIYYHLLWMQYTTPKPESDPWLKLAEDRVTMSGHDSMGQVTRRMLKVSGYVRRAAWLRPKRETITWEFRDFQTLSDFENWDMLRNIGDDEREWRFMGEGEQNLIAKDETGRPIAIGLLDTERACSKYILCLAVISTRGLILEYLAEQKAYQHIGCFMFSDPTWMSKCPVSTITIV